MSNCLQISRESSVFTTTITLKRAWGSLCSARKRPASTSPHLDGREQPDRCALVADERAPFISLQLNEVEVAQHPVVEPAAEAHSRLVESVSYVRVTGAEEGPNLAGEEPGSSVRASCSKPRFVTYSDSMRCGAQFRRGRPVKSAWQSRGRTQARPLPDDGRCRCA